MDFVLASNNKHKLLEVKRILCPQGHTVLSLAEAGISANPEENGVTFIENAVIKAIAVKKLCGSAVLADDSGLVVDALNGEPGVYSARFAGEHCCDESNNQKLLRLMRGIPKEKRGAKFICAIAVVFANGAIATLEGECKGEIGFEPKGDNGFGYDPLFYVGTRSYAQFSNDEKDSISHRRMALAKLEKILQKHSFA